MRPYLVRNTRPFKVLQVLDHALAPKETKGRSDAWLTEEEFLSDLVQELLQVGRLELVAQPEMEKQIPADATSAKLVGATKLEISDSAGVEDASSTPEATFLDSQDGEVEAAVEAILEQLPLPPLSMTREELESFSFDALRKLAEERRVKRSGGKAALVDRLLGVE